MRTIAKRHYPQKPWKRYLKRSGSVLLVLFFVGVLLLAVWIESEFDSRVQNDFLLMAAKGEAPHFYVYQFSDRTNREGVAEPLLEGTPTQGTETSYVSFSDLPKHVVDAFVAIEDKRFFAHDGVDWYRTASATVHYLLGSKNRFGASTITQQLVKNVTGNSELTLRRKLQEMLYALDLERSLDKTEIFEQYVNVIPFSDRCNGIAAAAEHYFGKTPQRLTIAEGATLVRVGTSIFGEREYRVDR